MKQIIALSLLALTACGSGGPGTQSAQTSSPAIASDAHYLMIVDSPMAALPTELRARGIDVTVKQVTGFRNYTANDGFVIEGAAERLADWLNDARYDGIIVAVGGVETLHAMGYPGPRPYATFQMFMSFLGSTGYQGKLYFVVTPNGSSGAYAMNNRRSLGLDGVADAGFLMTTLADTYTPDATGMATIADQLVTYL